MGRPEKRGRVRQVSDSGHAPPRPGRCLSRWGDPPAPPRARRRGRGRGLGLATRRKPGDLRDGGNKRAAGRGRGWAVTAAAPRPGVAGSYGAGRGACGWMKGRPCRVPRGMGPPFEGLEAEIPVPELAAVRGGCGSGPNNSPFLSRTS